MSREMVLLSRGLFRVRQKGFRSGINLWYELSKSSPTQGFIEWVELLLLSLWKAVEGTFVKRRHCIGMIEWMV